MAAQLEAFGAPPEVVAEECEREAASDVCEIHEDNLLVFSTFLALQTQWRIAVGGMGPAVYLGLDYSAIPVVLDELGVLRKARPTLIGELRTMEYAALPQLNRKRGE